jgi:PRC-barrel domain protein
MQRTTLDIFVYRDTTLGSSIGPANVVGFKVEALDGSIGKVDDATLDAGGGVIVVDTGPWIFGKKVMLPAGVIRDVDHGEQKIFVNRTKDEIKDAPEFDEALRHDDTYRDKLGSYYSEGGHGYRDWDSQ